MLPGITPALFGGGDGPGNDAFTVLLLHGDGPSGSTVFTDSSPAQHAVGSGTAAGAAITTLQAKFGGSSVALAPNPNGYLAVGTSSDFDFGTADFTIDWWEWRLDTADGRPVVIRTTATQTYVPFLIGYTEAGILKAYASSNNASWDILTSVSMGAAVANTWQHFAIVRKGTTFYTFRNGALIATATSALAFPASAGALCIGIWNITGTQQYNFNGYLDEFRISKGIARWTSNFIPPRQAYAPNYVPDVTTKLLMHFDTATGVTDSSPSAHGAATTAGTGVGVTGTQKKFGDGSCLFPGGGACVYYLDNPDFNFGAGDFTIDCWARVNTLGVQYSLFGKNNAGLTNGYGLYVNTSGTVQAYWLPSDAAFVGLQSAALLADTNWHHYVLQRAGGLMQIYFDGVLAAQGAITPTASITTNNNAFAMGQLGELNAIQLNGYIDEFRISKVARWSGNFSPPSAPYNPVTTLGPATHFLVTAPATASINSALNVTVQALDANNNATNNYTGTVHFTSTDGAAVLPANSILSSGVGTFAVTLKTLGSFTITATDTVTGTINGTSGPVSVLAVRNVAISASQANINLRTLHDALFPAPDASTVVVFTLNAGVKISSGGYGTPSLNVGSWPAGADLTLYIAGDARGAGGNGGDSGGPNAQPGGTAIYTRVPIKLACAGTIWGGGGGGGGSTTNALAGGGGAGIIGGPGGYGVGVAGGQANPGTETAGGAAIWFGGAGGGPGQAGTAASPGWPGAAAGYSIDGIGYVTTGSWNGTVFTPGVLGGDVRGSQG